MRITIICPDWFPNISGFGLSAYEFACRLTADGHKVTIITPSQKRLDRKDLNVVAVKKLFNLLGRNPLVMGLLGKIRKTEPEIILLYSYMFEMNARVAFWKKMGRIKCPVILMYRGSLENYTLPFLSPVTRLAKRIYDATCGRFLFRNVDHIISNSKPTISEINKRFKVPTSRMAYIPSAVEVKDFKQSRLDNRRVLFSGRLIENKGINLFPKIISAIPRDWKFTIIGDGPMQKEVETLAKKNSNIEYLGKLKHSDCIKMYSRSDILVLPTYAEGSPRVVLEACASGVPSIVFDVGDVQTILDGNRNGYCIERYNSAELINKLKKLVKESSARNKMGRAAREYATKNLDWPEVYSKMVKEIRRVK